MHFCDSFEVKAANLIGLCQKSQTAESNATFRPVFQIVIRGFCVLRYYLSNVGAIPTKFNQMQPSFLQSNTVFISSHLFRVNSNLVDYYVTYTMLLVVLFILSPVLHFVGSC